ncbi:MAG: nucleotidyltransferase [candidate division WOR-3 bacterium]|nr:nucleotidyltransferase [candidate division WOR-3 bacterium]
MEEMIQAFVKVLEQFKIKYAIIGGIAASVWGKPRMTLDADVVVLLSIENIADFLKALRANGFLISESSEPKIISRLRRFLPIKVRYTKSISCDVRISSYSIDQNAIERAKKIKMFNTRVAIATPEDVIVYKLVRFEDIDKADIKTIVQRMGKKLDFAYIKNSVKQLSQEIGDKNILNNLHFLY